MKPKKAMLFLLLSSLLLSTLFTGCITKKETLEYDGRTRSYIIHIPSNYTDSQPIPLLIALHGGGGNSENMMEKTGFNTLADNEGFIVVYPDGTGKLKNRLLTWNAGHCCGYALENMVDDVGFIRALIQNLQDTYNIDSKQIFVTGHSNGGMMTYRLGAELSDIIAAIAPVAGTIGGHETENSTLYIIPEPDHPVSVIALHGLLDEHVPYYGGHGKNSSGTRIDVSVNESIAFWVENNQCNTTPYRYESESGNIIIDTYSEGQNGVEVTLVTIVNGGHWWPGSDKDPYGGEEINGADIIWDFFKTHPKQ